MRISCVINGCSSSDATSILLIHQCTYLSSISSRRHPARSHAIVSSAESVILGHQLRSSD